MLFSSISSHLPTAWKLYQMCIRDRTNTLPDLVYEGAFTMSSFYHKGNIVAIDDIISEDDRKDIAAGIWENCQVEGETFVFPFAHMPWRKEKNSWKP